MAVRGSHIRGIIKICMWIFDVDKTICDKKLWSSRRCHFDKQKHFNQTVAKSNSLLFNALRIFHISKLPAPVSGIAANDC